MVLLKDESRNYIFCPNEVAVELTSQRLRDETDNDFNDRLIRLGACMYAEVIQSYADAEDNDSFRGCLAFMISNDVDNRVRVYVLEAEAIHCIIMQCNTMYYNTIHYWPVCLQCEHQQPPLTLNYLYIHIYINLHTYLHTYWYILSIVYCLLPIYAPTTAQS
jgi:hypothetical protein